MLVGKGVGLGRGLGVGGLEGVACGVQPPPGGEESTGVVEWHSTVSV